MNETKKTRFSVVIPIYNERKNIIRAIESVFAQTINDYEIVIVDDGSVDGSANLIQQNFRAQIETDNSIKLVRQLNSGISVARNRGVKEAKGEIIAFLEAYDTWEPHFLEEIAMLANSFPEARSYASAYQLVSRENVYIDPNVKFSKTMSRPRILSDFFDVGARGSLPFVVSSFCIDKNEFLRLGAFPVGEAHGIDQDLFCRVAMRSTIAYSYKVGAFKHLDPVNQARESNIPEEQCGFARRLRENVSNETEDFLKSSIKNYLASHLLHLAALNINAKRHRVASRLLDDHLCKLQYPRYLWFRFRCLLLQLTSKSEKEVRSGAFL